MSKHHHSSTAFEVDQLIGEVRAMDAEELSATHGIEINKDRTVYDAINNKTFSSLLVWAQSVVDEEMNSTFQHMQHKQRFDDDYL
jgi:hypothetical protein